MEQRRRERDVPDYAPEASADEYRVVAERFVDPLFHAFDGVVRWIGPSVEEALGWTPADIAATPLIDLCHHDDVEGLSDLLGRVASGQPGRGVFRLRAKDGTYPWVLLSLGGGTDESGQVGVVGSMREINLRVHAERQLLLIAEHASNVLFTAGRDRRVTWVSPNLTHVLGWPVESLVGSVVNDLIHPADRASVELRLDLLYSGAANAEPLTGDVLRVRRRDGSFIWMEATAAILRDENGRPDGMVGGFIDVDELVVARNRIREDAVRLQTILDGLLDSHALLGPVRAADGRIVDFVYSEVNDAGVSSLGATRAGVIGSLLTHQLPGAVARGLVDVLAEAMESGEPLVLEDFRYPAPGAIGPERHLEIRAVRLADALSVIWRDVTDQRQAVAALAASEEQYRLLAKNSSDVVMRSRGGTVLWASPSLVATLGWTPAEWIGRRTAEFVHLDDAEEFEEARSAIEAGRPMVHRFRLRGRDQTYHWVEAHASPYLDVDGNVDGIVATFRTIDAEVAAKAELDRRARYDELTGLLNRKEVLERMAAMGGHARRTGSESAVLFCDVDRFKSVNDAFGHAAGDVVLRELAARINGCIRARDLAARVGGDEMLVVLDGVHGLADAVAVAEKIRLAAERPITAGSAQVTTSVSIGVALAQAGDSIDALIARADDAMFEAKAQGRNQVITIDSDEARAG